MVSCQTVNERFSSCEVIFMKFEAMRLAFIIRVWLKPRFRSASAVQSGIFARIQAL